MTPTARAPSPNLGVTLAGALAGLIPGMQAYRVDVAGVLRQAEGS